MFKLILYYLFILKRYIPVTTIGSTHYGENKEIKSYIRAEGGAREGIEVRILPQIPYALPGHSSQSRWNEGRGNRSHSRIRKDCSIQLGEMVRERWHFSSEGERFAWTEAIDDISGYREGKGSCKETSGEYKDCKGGMAGGLEKRGEQLHLQTFFRIAGARYKRIRKRPRETPSPQLVELKCHQLQELVDLWSAGWIRLYFGDESHVCTSGYVPYGWQFDDEDVSVPSQNKDRLNIFGMVSPDCKYEGFDTTGSITGDRIAEWLDNFSKRIDRPTFVVLDNASIHRKGEVARKIPEWKERGLYIFYLPPYSPHLNITETVWRFLKAMWLKPHHYCSRSTLHEATREILDGIGNKYIINFSHAA